MQVGGNIHIRFAVEQESRFKVSGKHVASQVAESQPINLSLGLKYPTWIVTTYVNFGALCISCTSPVSLLNDKSLHKTSCIRSFHACIQTLTL